MEQNTFECSKVKLMATQKMVILIKDDKNISFSVTKEIMDLRSDLNFILSSRFLIFWLQDE